MAKIHYGVKTSRKMAKIQYGVKPDIFKYAAVADDCVARWSEGDPFARVNFFLLKNLAVDRFGS